jgi:DNA-binding NarL/FixJ family response regulator
MKNNTIRAHHDLSTHADATHGPAGIYTRVAGRRGEPAYAPILNGPARENPKPSNLNLTARKQIEELTARELEVLQFIARGRLNKQAASELCISIKTVEKHRQQLKSKLGVHGTAGLTHFAIYAGVIECNPQLEMA